MAQCTIEQLRSELKLTKDDFVGCQESLQVARSESRTQYEEVRRCQEERRSAIATAEAAQRDATEKMGRIRDLELELAQARSSQAPTQTKGEKARESPVDMKPINAKQATRRRQNLQAGGISSTASLQPQLHQQQPGLVITPEALNLYVRPACLVTRNLVDLVPSLASLLIILHRVVVHELRLDGTARCALLCFLQVEQACSLPPGRMGSRRGTLALTICAIQSGMNEYSIISFGANSCLWPGVLSEVACGQ
eukprot:COSAG02_NODE_6406_length_3594_cov_2.434049_1_plen_252_part_00